MSFDELEERIGLRFADPELLRQALTHRSFVNEYDGQTLADNERLEFLGDAILDFVVGDMLYQRYPDMPEGELTRLRAALVRTEALVGAIYLDQGLQAVRYFILPRLDRLLQRVLAENLHKDARSELQEWSQAEIGKTPIYRTAGADGPDHDKEFMVEATIGDRIVGRGVGRSKQSAAQAAARAALKLFERGELHWERFRQAERKEDEDRRENAPSV